jgi:hypothetical protein
MSRKIVVLAFATVVATLLMASEAQAWGCAHVGFTHVGYGGVQHYGRTVAAGPYGMYSGGHVGGYGYGGAYHAGYGYGGAYGGAVGGYHYGYSPYGGYSAGGFRYGTTYPGYAGGVYRYY